MEEEKNKTEKTGLTRRQLLSGSAKLTAMAGVVGTTGLVGLAGMTPKAAIAASKNSPHVGPGDLDEYYGFWSSGQAGEMRILGMPSMLEAGYHSEICMGRCPPAVSANVRLESILCSTR